MANIITAVRIICSIAVLFVPLFSPAFYVLYITAGVSDIADWMIARRTGTESDFGSKLDLRREKTGKPLSGAGPDLSGPGLTVLSFRACCPTRVQTA